jgi:flagellar hook-basal body complex protein FliE
MNEISSKGLEMTNLLRDMQGMAQKATGAEMEGVTVEKTSFQKILGKAINNVGSLQQQSETMQTSYELGSKEFSLADVMVATQKANLSFQALSQVRNKLVSAYKEIMNMPV